MRLMLVDGLPTQQLQCRAAAHPIRELKLKDFPGLGSQGLPRFFVSVVGLGGKKRAQMHFDGGPPHAHCEFDFGLI